MLQLQKKMQIEFENIAGKILKENSKDLAELGQKNANSDYITAKYAFEYKL